MTHEDVIRFADTYGLNVADHYKPSPSRQRGAIMRKLAENYPDLAQIAPRVVGELLRDGDGAAVDIARKSLGAAIAQQPKSKDMSGSNPATVFDVYTAASPAELQMQLCASDAAILHDPQHTERLHGTFLAAIKLNREYRTRFDALNGIFSIHSDEFFTRSEELSEEQNVITSISHVAREHKIPKGPVFKEFENVSFSVGNTKSPLVQLCDSLEVPIYGDWEGSDERRATIASALMIDITRILTAHADRSNQ